MVGAAITTNGSRSRSRSAMQLTVLLVATSLVVAIVIAAMCFVVMQRLAAA
jgi:hypothetical protein